MFNRERRAHFHPALPSFLASQLMTTYSDAPPPDALRQAQTDLGNVKDIMVRSSLLVVRVEEGRVELQSHHPLSSFSPSLFFPSISPFRSTTSMLFVPPLDSHPLTRSILAFKLTFPVGLTLRSFHAGNELSCWLIRQTPWPVRLGRLGEELGE